MTLAYNVGSPEEVDAVTEEARAAGATIGREPAETFWGGYSSIFIDPEGHPWEVAHNPHWTITAGGRRQAQLSFAFRFTSSTPARARDTTQSFLASSACSAK